MKGTFGYVVVDGPTLNGMLGVEYHAGGKIDVPLGTYFGAVFFKRKFAVEKARQWGYVDGKPKVVRVRIEEDKR